MANYHTTTKHYFKEQLELSKESLLILSSKLIRIIASLGRKIKRLSKLHITHTPGVHKPNRSIAQNFAKIFYT